MSAENFAKRNSAESVTERLVESRLDPDTAVVDEICAAGEPWVKLLMQGQTLRIVDLEGTRRWIRCFTTQPMQWNATAPPIPSAARKSST
jgi:hypothetical protein